MFFLSALNQRFSEKKRVFLQMFIFNAILFGIASAFSALSGKKEIADNYPIAVIFVWSIVIFAFLFFSLKKMFLFNLIPLLLFAIVNMFIAPVDNSNMNEGWQLQWTIELVILGAFFVLSIIFQIIETSRAIQYNKIALSEKSKEEQEEQEQQEDLQQEYIAAYNRERHIDVAAEFRPIVNDESIWTDKSDKKARTNK